MNQINDSSEEKKEEELTPEEIDQQIKEIEKTMGSGISGGHYLNLMKDLKRLRRKKLKLNDPLGTGGRLAEVGLDGLTESEFWQFAENTRFNCSDFVEQFELSPDMGSDWQADLRCSEWAHQEVVRQKQMGGPDPNNPNSCRWVLILLNPSNLLMQRLSMLARGRAYSNSGGWEGQPFNIWVLVITCSKYPDRCGPPMQIEFLGCPTNVYSD